MAKKIAALPKTTTLPPTTQPNQVIETVFQLKTPILVGLTLGLAVLYYLLSFSADGFYQQDEAAHYVSMLNFWNNPNTVISNWAKPGYKFIYALPVLLGKSAVMALNCLFAAFSCYMSYRVAEKLGSRLPLLVFLLLAFQPLWIGLSFRNYSELPAAYLLVACVYCFLNEKTNLSALIASYICLIRQEFYPFLGLYFLYFAYRKQFLAAALLCVFPLLHNIWGFFLTKDVFYLLNQVLGTSSKIGDAYPRAGFDHYLRFSGVIYGSITVTLLTAYAAAKVTQKKLPPLIVFLPMALYFLMYCIFNLQAFPIGPSSAGNLRYLVIISPLTAVFAGLGIEEVKNTENKNMILGALAILFVFAAVYMTYEHNFVRFDEQARDWKVMIGIFASTVLLFFPLSLQQKLFAFAALSFFMALISLKPIKMGEEDKKCSEIAAWYQANYSEKSGVQVLYQHDMISYFMNKPKGSFEPVALDINEENVQKAPKGSIIIWDSHYSYRPELRKGCLQYEYFIKKPNEYEMLQQFMTQDQTFGALVFRKL